MTGTQVKLRAVYLVTVLGLAVIMANGAFVGTAAAANAPDCSGVTYSESDGSLEVGNVEQLQCINENHGDASDRSDALSKDYVLVSDIDASDTENWNSGKGFEPIGKNADAPFTGMFDGDGYEIEGLTIDRPDQRFIGLFGIAEDATLENLRLADVDVTGKPSEDHASDGLSGVGGLAGTVRQTGTDSTAKVENVSVSGTITGDGEGYNVAGLVGFSTGTADDHGPTLDNENVFNGTVKAEGADQVAGITGRSNYATDIGTSYVRGEITGDKDIGGIVGHSSGNPSTVENVYAAVEVSGTNSGAIVGNVGSGDDEFKESVYWDSDLESEAAGSEDSSATLEWTELSTNEMQGESAEDEMRNLDWENTWQVVPGDYPVFQWEAAAADGDEVDSIEAADVEIEPNANGDITVTATDEFGNEIEGEEIEVDDADGLDDLSSDDTATTDENGEATFSFETGEQATYEPEFSAEDDSISDTATVTLMYAAGEGTDTDPYQIEDWNHLDNVRENLDGEFVLNNDLTKETDGYDEVANDSANDGKGFEPIGSCGNGHSHRYNDCSESASPFTGTFDGGSNQISNLTIDRQNGVAIGLFGLAQDADFGNLRLANVSITGEENVGGLVGHMQRDGDTYPTGSVENVSVRGNVTWSEVDDEDASGGQFGGIVGLAANTKLDNQNVFVGNVTGKFNVGGLVGRMAWDTTIGTSYAQGTVTADANVGDCDGIGNGECEAGGLAGNSGNPSDISNAYAAVTVDAPTDGAIIGTDNDGSDGDTLTDVYWDEDVGPSDASSGSIDDGSSGEYTGLTTEKMQGSSAESNMNFDWSNTWQTVAGDYPVFQWEADAAGDADGLDAQDTTHVPDAEGEITVVATDSGVPVEGEEITVEDDDGLSGLENSVSTDEDGEAEFSFETGEQATYEPEFSAEDDSISDTATVKLMYAAGEGTDTDPYQIEDWNHLDNVRDNLNANFTLSANLDESTDGYDSVASEDANGDHGFEPIGSDGDEFTGSFDGQGNEIEGLVIERPDTDEVGLFGNTDGSLIENVGLVDVDINGDNGVGGLVGGNFGEISESYATGSVDGSDVVGGLVGFNDGEISESYATGSVEESGNLVGGLVGINDGEISESYATGSVDGSSSVGGLVGWNEDGDISESYATGSVDGSDVVGGLVGDNGGEISESYWDTETTGQSSSDGGTGLTTDEMKGDAAESNMEGFDFESTWDVDTGAIVSYPFLVNNTQEPAPGLQEDGVFIEDWNDLDDVRNDLDGDYALANDLDEDTDGYDEVASETANGGAGFEPIGENNNEFTGSFDGQGNEIEGLVIDREPGIRDGVGLFGNTDGSLIENVGLVDVDINGDDRTGGLVGFNDGGDISESYATGSVEGDNFVGGLVGENGGEISESYATGSVDGSSNVGGLVGQNGGEISESYATGSVDGGNGLVGNNFGDVEDSYWDTETTGQDESAGSPDENGLTTSEMTGLNATDNMDGFEFPDGEGTWHVVEDDYPALAWEDTDPFYGVEIDSTNAQIDEGETLEVETTVTNWAADGGDQTIELLDFEDAQADTESVDDLDSGDSSEFTLEWNTEASDAGTDDVTVESEDDTDTEEVTIEEVEPESLDAEVTVDDAIADGEDEVEFTITVEDDNDNAIEGVTVEVDDADVAELGGIEAGDEEETDADGEATFTATSTDTGEFTVVFEEPEEELSDDATATFVAGDADSVAVETQPDDSIAGESISGDGDDYPEALVTDESDNPVEDVTVTVGETTHNALTGESTTEVETDTDGIAPFDDLVIEDAGEDYELEFSIDETDDDVESSDSATSATFDIEPGDADSISSIDVDDEEIAYDAGSTTVTVEAEDEFGNLVEDEDDALTLEIDGAEHSDSVTDVDISVGNAEIDIDDQEAAGADDLATAVGNFDVEAEVDATGNTDSDDLTVYPDNVDVSFQNDEGGADEDDTEELELALTDGDETLEGGEVDEVDVEYTLDDAPEGYDDEAGLDSETFGSEGDTITVEDLTDATATPTFAATRAGEYTIAGDVQDEVTLDATQDQSTITVDPVLADFAVDDATIDQGDALEVSFNDAEDKAGETFEGEEDVTVDVDDFDGIDEAETITVDFDGNGESTDEVLSESETEDVDAETYEDVAASADDTPAEDTFDVTVEGVPESLDATVTEDNAVADGDDEVEFTVTVEDINGDPIEGVTVEVDDAEDVDDLDGIEDGDTNETDADGEATFTATSTDTGEFTVEFFEQAEDNSGTATATFEVEEETTGSGGGTGGTTTTPDEGTEVTVDDSADATPEADDAETDADRPTPDTSVSVSNPEPGQTLVIENGDARIVDDPDHVDEEDAEQPDDADATGPDVDDDDDAPATNVRADRLTVEIDTDRDFELSVTTYEDDLTPSATIRGGDPSASIPAAPVQASGVTLFGTMTATSQDSDVQPPDDVQAAAESFEGDTGTVSAGYVEVNHTLDPEEIAGATFEFSIRQAYLEELGVEPEGVDLYHQTDDEEWVVRETDYVDSDDTYHRFEGTMPEFSVFALGTGAATIDVTDARLAQDTIEVDEEATITATVENRGQAATEETVELILDGNVVDAESVDLEGGQFQNVTLTFSPDDVGEYSLTVESVDLERLTVEAADEETAATDEETGYLPLLLLVLGAIVLLALVLWRRREEEDNADDPLPKE